MTPVDYINEIHTQVKAARAQGATKIVLNAEAIENALDECIQVAELGGVLRALEALSFDTDDMHVLEQIRALTEDLVENASYTSGRDQRLFAEYLALLNRLQESGLAVDPDDEDDDGYTEYDDDDYDDDDEEISSFRQPAAATEVAEVEAVMPQPSARGSWLAKILGRT